MDTGGVQDIQREDQGQNLCDNVLNVKEKMQNSPVLPGKDMGSGGENAAMLGEKTTSIK
jgi:hypothetical protein